jgi:hypothetical protein
MKIGEHPNESDLDQFGLVHGDLRNTYQDCGEIRVEWYPHESNWDSPASFGSHRYYSRPKQRRRAKRSAMSKCDDRCTFTEALQPVPY